MARVIKPLRDLQGRLDVEDEVPGHRVVSFSMAVEQGKLGRTADTVVPNSSLRLTTVPVVIIHLH